MSLSSELARLEKRVLAGEPGSFDKLAQTWGRLRYDIERAVEFAVKCCDHVKEHGLHTVEAGKVFVAVEYAIQKLPECRHQPGRGFYPEPMNRLWLEWEFRTEVVLVDPFTGQSIRPKRTNDHYASDPVKALSTRIEGRPPEVRGTSVWIEFKRNTFFTMRHDKDHNKGDLMREYTEYILEGKQPEEIRNAVCLADWEPPIIPFQVPELPSWTKDPEHADMSWAKKRRSAEG